MIAPTPDFVLLEKVYEHITHLADRPMRRERDHEGNTWIWDQRDWREQWQSEGGCSTAMCFAGWTAQIDGAEWVGEDDDRIKGEDGGEHISRWAARRLRLTQDEASLLFRADNGIDLIRRAIDLIKVAHGAL